MSSQNYLKIHVSLSLVYIEAVSLGIVEETGVLAENHLPSESKLPNTSIYLDHVDSIGPKMVIDIVICTMSKSLFDRVTKINKAYHNPQTL